MEFKAVHKHFIDAVASMSLTSMRQHLNLMKYLDQDLARECCLKILCSLSEEQDYSPATKEIIDSQLFEPPFHQSLHSVTSTLVYNAARLCTSTETLLLSQNLTHLSSRIKSNISDLLDILDDDGYSALHLSVMNGDKDSTNILLELGLYCNKRSDSGHTALSLAIAYGYDHLVPPLLNKSDVNTQDSDHDTPLMFAAWNNRPKTLSALIDCGADINAENKYGSRAIWNAVYQSCPECVLILLSHNSSMDVLCEGTHLFCNENESFCNQENVAKLYPGLKRSLLWVAVDKIGVNEQSLKVLLILLESGYDVTREHWLRNMIQLPNDCPKILNTNAELLRMLQFFYKNPQSLKDISRNTLRKHHRLSSNLCFYKWLRELRLPSTIKNFLTLSHIVNV